MKAPRSQEYPAAAHEAAGTAVAPKALAAARRRFVIRDCDECLNCGYCIIGSRHSSNCSECGWPIAFEIVDFRVSIRWMYLVMTGLMSANLAMQLIAGGALNRATAVLLAVVVVLNLRASRKRPASGVALSDLGVHVYGLWRRRHHDPFVSWEAIREVIHGGGAVMLLGERRRALFGFAQIHLRRHRDALVWLLNLGIAMHQNHTPGFVEHCRAALAGQPVPRPEITANEASHDARGATSPGGSAGPPDKSGQ